MKQYAMNFLVDAMKKKMSAMKKINAMKHYTIILKF